MFYSQFILAKKGPLGTIWIAAHLERKLRKNQVTETNISVSVDSILFPEVPIALRLSGHLLLGVVRIYSRKVNYLFHDCSEALVKIKQAFHAGAVDLPPEAATAPFHSITLPETFDLDEFEPLPDREMHLLHSNGAVDHHVTTREQITLQDPLEDSSYLESQFGLDERFPEGDVPRMGIDFDEDLLDKPSREASPDAVTLQEDEVLRVNMGDGMDYDEMDRMEPMDVDDDHHEPGTPALGMDMDLDYQPEAEGIEDGDLNRSPGMIEDLERDRHSEEIEHDNFELELNKPDQLEPATPGTLETEEDEGKGVFVEEADKEEKVDEEETAEKPGIDDHVQKADEEEPSFEKEEVDKQEVVEDERAGLEVERETSLEREREAELLGEGVGEGERQGEAEGEVEVEGEVEGDVEGEGEGERLGGLPREDDGKLDVDYSPEMITAEEDGKVDDENKQEVPEYETVMSAVEVPNQEPDVFDLDQDMEREMPFKDQDVFVEDKDPMLVEDREAVMQLDDPILGAGEPVSPVNSPAMPMFNPDALPGDDDVLASLLGRGTPALKLIPTPSETVAVPKPRRKQGQRKRKIVMDMTTILPADVMREQLMNTDDIRRVRRKAPCTRQELWSVQKDTLGQQIFCEHSVPGLCGDLRILFQRVYVAGEADLPLADDGQAEPSVSEAAPEQQEAFPLDDAAGEMQVDAEVAEVAEAHVELVIEDQVLQVSPNERLEKEADAAPVEVMANEAPREPDESQSLDDGQDAGKALPPIQYDEASPVDGAVAEAVEAETTDAYRTPAEIVNEDGAQFSTLEVSIEEKSPKSPTTEEPLLGLEQEVVEEREEVPSVNKEVDGDSITAPATEVVVVVDAETEAEAELDVEPIQPEVEAAGPAEPEPEPEVEVDPVQVAEIVNEDVPEVIMEEMLEPIPEMLPMNIAEDSNVDEQKSLEGEFVGTKTDDPEVASPPIQVEEAKTPEEQPPVEELGFLADSRDTVFLAADDDDLCEEAEDFQDGNDYGQKETLVQDNSGWAVGHYLRSTLESKDAHMKKREEEGIPKLGLDQILVGKSRKEAARMFFETLVLKTKDYIHVEQDVPYGDIQISARPKLLKANF
ncbi:hypothetical protein AXG93_115s1130 [Marchantia polymorpha subsp. ruderalis]|uniref:Rad21/Rec8-like protein N-terminal domain-containing protein n=1 Tax=Marchantia polymorpha subsp. ruderalis TaxID=1480154 RepID=A0A176W5Z4_MARPO|nr:hypothetical protein AXG93_115s1130 [Marchantia polymorpha subsp. ruderalis]